MCECECEVAVCERVGVWVWSVSVECICGACAWCLRASLGVPKQMEAGRAIPGGTRVQIRLRSSGAGATLDGQRQRQLPSAPKYDLTSEHHLGNRSDTISLKEHKICAAKANAINTIVPNAGHFTHASATLPKPGSHRSQRRPL